MAMSARDILKGRNWISLYELPDARAKVTRAVVPKSRADALALVKNGVPVSQAGCNGSVTIWMDRRKKIRCEFAQYRTVVHQMSATSLNQVREWLKAWWPEMGDVTKVGETK